MIKKIINILMSNVQILNFDDDEIVEQIQHSKLKNKNLLRIEKVRPQNKPEKTKENEGEIEQKGEKKAEIKSELQFSENGKGWSQNVESQVPQEPEKIQRIQQWLPFYIVTVICTLFIGIENVVIFMTNIFVSSLSCAIFILLVVTRIVFYLVMSFRICKNGNVLFKLYFTIDKIFLTEVVEIVSVTCYVSIFYPHAGDLKWFYIIYAIIYPLMLFSMTGYFRIMMVYCNWKPCQVIIYKISLMVGAVSFFGIGIYYTVKQVKFTDGENAKIDQLIKDIIFLYIFAGFQLFNQIFSKVDDIDGTATFKGGYKLECNDDDMELLLKGTSKLKRDDEQYQMQEVQENQQRNKTENKRNILGENAQLESIYIP